MIPIEIQIGQRFGRFVVIESSSVSKHGERRWLCRCDCGTTKTVPGSALRAGKVRSCGCLKRENNTRRIHGGRRTKLYEVFKTMHRRCEKPTSNRYAYYGGRGISVCDEWSDFESFRNWAYANGYGEGLTLDRIDNNGNYSPDNCRWATMKEQSNNRRNSVIVEIDGVRKTVAEWSDVSGISPYTLYSRVNRGITGKQLLKGGNYDPY